MGISVGASTKYYYICLCNNRTEEVKTYGQKLWYCFLLDISKLSFHQEESIFKYTDVLFLQKLRNSSFQVFCALNMKNVNTAYK